MPDSTGQPPSSRQITLIVGRRAGLLGKNCDICLSDCEEDIDRRYPDIEIQTQIEPLTSRLARPPLHHISYVIFKAPKLKTYTTHTYGLLYDTI